MAEKTLKEQLEMLETWPDPREFAKPDQGSSVPYLSGDIIKYKLNAIFGPQNWGYETISWPHLVEVGDAAFYLGEYEVWFRFADGTLIKRQVSGLVPLRGGAEGAKTNIIRMGIGGCVTDAIKEAAATLGPALGLGVNDEAVKAIAGPQQQPRRQSPLQPQNGDKPATAYTEKVRSIPAWLNAMIEHHHTLIAANPQAALPASGERIQGVRIAMARKLEAVNGSPSADEVWNALIADVIQGNMLDNAWLSIVSSWTAGRNFVEQATELVEVVHVATTGGC